MKEDTKQGDNVLEVTPSQLEGDEKKNVLLHEINVSRRVADRYRKIEEENARAREAKTMPIEQSSDEQSQGKKNELQKPELGALYTDATMKLGQDAFLAENQRMNRLEEQIKAKFPDYHSYQYYHWLTGSGPRSSIAPIGDDFPEEFSVTKFWQEFLDSRS